MVTTGESTASTRPVVLLAEDEESLRELGARVLTRAGFEVVLACDGQAAVEIFRSDPQAIAAAVFDYSMPRMNGEEAFLALREIRPEIPVVIWTGYGRSEAVARLGDAGAAILQKPVFAKDLIATVARAVSHVSVCRGG